MFPNSHESQYDLTENPDSGQGESKEDSQHLILIRRIAMPEEKNFVETILEKIDNLKTLEIRTIIGNFKWNPQTKKIEYAEGRVKSIITQIDLLEGDITTAFSEDFLEEPYSRIRDFHAEREKHGQEIINGNIKALRELVDLAVTAFRSKKDIDALKQG